MNKIDLEKQLSELYSTLDYRPLSANAISMYLMLLEVARKTSWSNKFQVANTTLMSKIKGLNLSALQRSRNELINAKLINYKKGSNQAEAPMYQVLDIGLLNTNEQPHEQADEQPSEQAREQADEHIITKLNLFYDYIINGVKNGDKIGLTEKDRPALMHLLRKYKLLINKDVLEKYDGFLPGKTLMDYKIQIFAIKELYCSPYKAGFSANVLSYEKIALKYLKTQKYIGSKENSSIKEFIDYFISCLQEVLENC